MTLSERDALLTYLGISPNALAEVRQLTAEGNELVKGKRRNIYSTPVYRFEVHYAGFLYQIGPEGCSTALTEGEGARLRWLAQRLRLLLNDYPYDHTTQSVIVPFSLASSFSQTVSWWAD